FRPRDLDHADRRLGAGDHQQRGDLPAGAGHRTQGRGLRRRRQRLRRRRRLFARRDPLRRRRRRAVAVADRAAADRARRTVQHQAPRPEEPHTLLVRRALPILRRQARSMRIRFTWLCGMVLLGSSIGITRAGAAADLKLAVVDMQRALNECDAGRRAKDQVKAKFEKAQDQLKRQREDLDRMKDDYDKKAVVLKDDERHNLEKNLESRTLEFKRKYEDFERDLKRTDSELTAGIVQDLYGVVHEYGQSHGYQLVLEASSGVLLYSDKASDITDEIVKIYNASPHRERPATKGSKDADKDTDKDKE